ncbi:MAG: GntR family transcriptional regulator [Betaproteobacteria bacterium]
MSAKARKGPAIKLQRDGLVAMHRQLAQHLRDAIQAGTYKQGDRIPTEPELTARFQVSRITARQAVMQLVREGLVARRQGKGTFVTALPVQHDLVALRGLFEELVARGVKPKIQLLEFGRAMPPPHVAEHLHSGEQALVCWKRLYLRNNEPFAVALVYLAPIVPKVTRKLVVKHTSYHILGKVMGLKIHHANISIRAQASTAEMRKLLHMPPATPVIALERVSYLADGTPVEYTLYCAHADAYEYAFRVGGEVRISDAIARRTEPPKK